MADDKPDVDAVTGTATTGHVWDGIRELNTPLPRWWLWLFYITIVWAIGYWVRLSGLAAGLLVHDRHCSAGVRATAVVADLDELKALRAPMTTKLAAASLGDIKNRSGARRFHLRAAAAPSFRENCGPCHGAGGGGAKGYPNLER